MNQHAGKYVLDFTESTTLDQVGGKGLNLLKLTQAGLPVPTGFVVSTTAYQAFVEANGLEPLIKDCVDAAQGPAAAPRGAAIRRAFEAGQFPDSLAAAIRAAYQALCTRLGARNAPVAVRSSATAEDLANASYAGQQDTYLNICGEAAVMEAIRRCLGSLWSDRALAYRSRQGLEPLAVRLAVVVQQMVNADAAGVAFTADPLSGDHELMVIEATWGLGEALVSGLVTPDHIVAAKQTGAALTYSVADKAMEILATRRGTQERAVMIQRRRARVLSGGQIRALTELGRRIEAIYGQPQDVEWCLAGGQLYIVQARPITTLPARPITWPAPGPGRWLHGGGSFEMVTEPISRFSESLLLPIFYQTLLNMMGGVGLESAMPQIPYQVVNGHIYLNMEFKLRPWHIWGILRDFALHMNSLENQAAEQAAYRNTVVQLAQGQAHLTATERLAQLQALGEAGLRYWSHIMKIVQVIYRQENAFISFYRSLRGEGDPEPEIFLRGQKIAPWEAECSTYDLAQLAQTLGLSERLQQDSAALLHTTEPEPAVRQWQSALQAHLERFGHQLSSFDLLLPTLADDPGPVLAALQTFLGGHESPYARQQRMTEERENALRALQGRLSSRQFDRFQKLLNVAQQAARAREDALFEVGLAWTPMRRIALQLGRHLADLGVLAEPDGIFWLSLEEVREALRQPASRAVLVSERQADAQLWSQVEAPYLLPIGSQPAFWWSWVFPTPELQRHPDARTLIGLGVSPGKVTAVARVIASLEEADRLQPGDILVAHTTTPAWTPLFARAAGLVTDLGGPLAHGSIVAREVGIPAVMGTGIATRKIRDGQRITLLGVEGRVVLEQD